MPDADNSSSYNDSVPGLTLKYNSFTERKVGFYISFGVAEKYNGLFNNNDGGLKLAVGPSFKLHETEIYNMNIGAAPQVSVYKDYFFLGIEIDFQTKFNTDRKFFPMLGIYSDINFFSAGNPSNKKSSSLSETESTFYLSIGYQFYIAFCINLE